MPISAIDVTTVAFQRMKEQLFTRFRFGQWWRLAVVGFLAGELSSIGGCNARLPGDFPGSNSASIPPVLDDITGPAIAALIGVLVVVALIIGMVFLYVSSRMRFVLFESVVTGECRIRESWRRYGTPAFRYFVWQAALLVVSMFLTVVLIGPPLLVAYQSGIFENPREHLFALIVGGLAMAGALLVVFVAFMVTQVLTKDFVVPQMALEDVTALEGWRRLWLMMKSEKAGYAEYVFMKFVLAIGAAIVTGLAGFMLLLLVLIPVGGAGLFAVLIGSAAGITWNPFTIAIAGLVALIVVLTLLLAMALISVPVTVFFPAYSLLFFADRYGPLHQLMFPPAPTSPL